jgi:hypothetical protein
MLANSPCWHSKGDFLSLRHGGHQILGFKSEGLNPERINADVKGAKVWESGSKTIESSNKCFHRVPWGIPRGIFIGHLGG